jgi:hypothetical protein
MATMTLKRRLKEIGRIILIDYEKLAEAHALADKYAKQVNDCVDVCVTLNRASASHPVIYSWEITGGNDSSRFCTIEEMIIHLESLTKPEPKYKKGDAVYASDDFLGIVCI